MRSIFALVSALFLGASARIIAPGAQWINLSRLPPLPSSAQVTRRASDAATFPQYNFTQPLDHFVHTGFTWNQRFWVSDRHYVPGGPVFVLDGGEDSGEDRLPYLDTGIVDILTNATGGLGIVLEHRYYGSSVPVLNFTTDSLRWLNIEQALADSANFMKNVQIPGISEDVTSPGRPWIYYGGSYAGARSAHMKVLYPDLVYGAIASSGVTYATVIDWQYYDIIRQFGPADCISQVETTILEVDKLLDNPDSHGTIKALFGLGNLTHDEDFASLLASPLGAWQSKNWDPAVNSESFDRFCTALGTPDNTTVSVTKNVTVSSAVMSYATYINETYAARCRAPSTLDDCFSSFNPDTYTATDLSETWRLWQFQVCTQWGFLMTAPPAGHPRIISNRLTLDYAALPCKFAYPPGEHFTVPALPNVATVNALGGLNIAADRLAIIDGQEDPWRPNTPHADIARPRPDTTIRPFKVIPGAVHHYDENGIANRSAEPAAIHTIHDQEIHFVQAWLKDFRNPK